MDYKLILCMNLILDPFIRVDYDWYSYYEKQYGFSSKN